MKQKDLKSLQKYSPLNRACIDILNHYNNELSAAIEAKDKNRIKVLISVLAVLNPIAFKKFLDKKKK